jgi:hypothetical protein
MTRGKAVTHAVQYGKYRAQAFGKILRRQHFAFLCEVFPDSEL